VDVQIRQSPRFHSAPTADLKTVVKCATELLIVKEMFSSLLGGETPGDWNLQDWKMTDWK